MNKRILFGILILLGLTSGFMLLNKSSDFEDDSKRIKIALREVGNQLLLINKDSTSLVLPVKQEKNNLYKIEFQNNLSIEPDSLVNTVKKVLTPSELSHSYLVEVLACENEEVAYSYEINMYDQRTIIPCLNRRLYESCYTINIQFFDLETAWYSNSNVMVFGILSVVILVLFLVILLKTFKEKKRIKTTSYTSIGNFKFYPEQNKLINRANEIPLSKKECELLELFVSRPNEIIKREELTKRVWEDHGVFVGRSLDTYVSKLRKKLKEDESIQIKNIHGVGYKLEVSS